MTTVKDYLEQYEWFKGGKEVTPLLIGRYDETRKPITEEEKSILVICQEIFEKDFDMFFLKKGALNRHARKNSFSRMLVRVII